MTSATGGCQTESAEELKMVECLKTLESTAKTPEAAKTFSRDSKDFLGLFRRFLQIRRFRTECVDWSTIQVPPPSSLIDHERLPTPASTRVRDLLSKLVVVKLNGGLGTTMGCTGPKSLIEAHSGHTFLDLIVAQIKALNVAHGADVPLVLMDSFNTHAETLEALRRYPSGCGVRVMTFEQSRHPRFDAESLAPVAKTLEEGTGHEAEWYPPGHADFYQSFANSGLLQKLRAEGREVVFLSNVDNLGATVDLAILAHLAESGAQYAMEVTPKTNADVKGGTLVVKDGKLRLLEIAQVPSAHVKDFESVTTFKIFNTNNLWVRADAIDSLLSSGFLHREIDIIVNKKPYGRGQTVVQLETAAGAAIAAFPKSCGIVVPRSRFLPVKNCSDLLLLQSDLHVVSDGLVTLSPERQRLFGTNEAYRIPTVRLGPTFKNVGDFLKRFSGGVPSIVGLQSLVVSGDVCFGRGVVLRGNVVVVAPPGSHIDIPQGSILDNKLVQGNILIQDL